MIGMPELSDRTRASHPPVASFEYVESRSIRLAATRPEGVPLAVPKTQSGGELVETKPAFCKAHSVACASMRGLMAL